MSSDNGIYVLKTRTIEGSLYPLEYRVLHAQAIDNLYYNFETGEHGAIQPHELYDYFKECQPLYSEEQAYSYAHQLEAQQSILEYGVSLIDESSLVFPKFSKQEMKDYWQRNEEIMTKHREEFQTQLESRHQAALLHLAPGTTFEVGVIYGYLIQADGSRVHGSLPTVGNIDIGSLNAEGVTFLPTDWNQEAR